MATDDAAEPMNWTEQFVKSAIYTLIVGKQRSTQRSNKLRRLCAHEAHLVRVPFFEKMLNSGFRESKEKIIHMPEDDPKAIEFVLAYLHHGRVSAALDKAGLSGDLDEEDEEPNMGLRLAELWMFADKLQFTALQNDLIAAMVAWANEVPADVCLGAETMTAIYEGTLPGSKLREFAVALEWTSNQNLVPGSFVNGDYEVSQEVMADLLIEAYKRLDDLEDGIFESAVFRKSIEVFEYHVTDD